jgi:isocitrate/isopropylmalate dehydrogenase
MRTHRIAAMGGDGIGPEVVAAGVTFKISIGARITTRSTVS